MTKKTLRPYFLVYSPKVFDSVKLNYLTTTLCDNSPHALVTVEYGDNKSHKHANFFFYHSCRDAFNLKRIFKWKVPEYKVKAVSSINNVISYMVKEGRLG